jgi:hypothetical protein
MEGTNPGGSAFRGRRERVAVMAGKTVISIQLPFKFKTEVFSSRFPYLRRMIEGHYATTAMQLRIMPLKPEAMKTGLKPIMP